MKSILTTKKYEQHICGDIFSQQNLLRPTHALHFKGKISEVTLVPLSFRNRTKNLYEIVFRFTFSDSPADDSYYCYPYDNPEFFVEHLLYRILP